MKLSPMPKLPRLGKSSPTKRTKRAVIPGDLDRRVMWREGEEVMGELSHTYGTCAKCGQRKQALDLKWRPDRMIDGEFHQGFWACAYGCE